MTKPKQYIPSRIAVQWTDKDAGQAQKEGWDIFDCSDLLEIEALSENTVRFEEDGDLAAVHWVFRKALQGSPMHVKAIIHLLIESPDHFIRDVKELGAAGLLVGVDRSGKHRKPTEAPTVAFWHKRKHVTIFATTHGADIFVDDAYLETIDGSETLEPNEWAGKAVEHYLSRVKS